MSGRPDYDVGDVVVCVNSDPISCPVGGFHLGHTAPRMGSIGRVAAFKPSVKHSGNACGCVDAVLSCGAVGIAPRFRKIDAADEAFTRQMRAIKPAKVAA